MRNAIDIGNGLVVTTDNSGGIGEKAGDIVNVPDRVTAYYAARVVLLEQWAAAAEPIAVMLHNFSGRSSWEKYVQGVTDLFDEAGIEVPEISGSTETNMELLQSAMAVTMIGKRVASKVNSQLSWYTYGTPLVGDEVLERAHEMASIRLINEARNKGLVQRIWPVGSRGLLAEVRTLTQNKEIQIDTVLTVEKSAGPSTVVLLAVPLSKTAEAEVFFCSHLTKLSILLLSDFRIILGILTSY